MKKKFGSLLITAVVALSIGAWPVQADSYVGFSGKFTDDGSAILSVAEQSILPKGWQAFFEDNEFRSFPIEWMKGQSWEGYLDATGKLLHIAVIIDGSNRRVYFATPSGMFEAGSHVLNPNSLVHAQNTTLKEIIRRSEVNLSRYEQQEIARRYESVAKEREELDAKLAELDAKRAEVRRELAMAEVNATAVPMRNDFSVSADSGTIQSSASSSVSSSMPALPPGLPSHSEPGSEETLYQSVANDAVAHHGTASEITTGSSVTSESSPRVQTTNLYASTTESYSFKVYQGLVIADNLTRFADFIGYKIHLKNVPTTCDFESYANETITGNNKLAMFREYANRYFFSVDPQPATNPNDENIVVLTYSGDTHVFEGCMK